MIGLIDYGSGNVHAIANIYKDLNIPYCLTSDKEKLSKADKLILPGVGDFDETMSLLDSNDLIKFIRNEVEEKKKIIAGVCVGMQIMAKNSEEGLLDGFGWFDATVKKLDETAILEKPFLPHMGWNNIYPSIENHSLLTNINHELGFYFLHSYYMSCEEDRDVLASSKYGINFPCIVKKENVIGIQFHPEKSHANGIQVFKNFANL